MLTPRLADNGVELRYRGLDNCVRSTEIRFDSICRD